ncbi:MAG: GntR family transcriptional regulator [Phycisphaerales bacterium]|jgi:DNA-binding transcriptional regulator YhcF (GntR family)|nr:GntR family transcriptional regulator [Phycisphaerales bacterium]
MAISTELDEGNERLTVQIREKVLRDLAKGNYPAGHVYATEGELAHNLSVSRNTIRKSMEQLENEGVLHRRKRVGILVGPRTGNDADAGTAAIRQRLVVVLPAWDDSIGGRYSGPLLRALSSPRLDPPLAVEIRHNDDEQLTVDDVILAVDPRGRQLWQLHKLVEQGGRVLLCAAGAIYPDFIAVDGERRVATAESVKKLYALGHRHVGLINHDVSHLAFSSAYLGFLDAHRELKRDIHANAIVQEMFCAQTPRRVDVGEISAWVCTFMAGVGMVGKACAEAGLRCPDDVSVITLDDPGHETVAVLGTPISAYTDDYESVAAEIHRLLHQWPKEKQGTITWIPSIWVDRGSIAPPSRG